MPGAPVVGLFVGGRGSRFGGRDKGNLVHPSGARLIVRLESVVRTASSEVPIVLVGASTAYGDLGLSSLTDAPAGIGPLGGLRALLAHAATLGRDAAVALACDLPYVTPELVRRLAGEVPSARALAPREGGRWYALTARYAVDVLPVIDEAVVAGRHSLQGIFERLAGGASVLTVDESELRALRDWDRPEDVES